ncbi:hypothetical protein LshimejAT787_0411790 [Lyophyllum shimeji]|uniref:Uncharacterized protein n=1 Tax=Lyophyllum shimeji TaxID=47721 RepID=A0A9P3PLH8_LYOSH|nr:hypothetical protein LshimejAT787_0411790 [Lyophyllum shimeji]
MPASEPSSSAAAPVIAAYKQIRPLERKEQAAYAHDESTERHTHSMMQATIAITTFCARSGIPHKSRTPPHSAPNNRNELIKATGNSLQTPTQISAGATSERFQVTSTPTTLRSTDPKRYTHLITVASEPPHSPLRISTSPFPSHRLYTACCRAARLSGAENISTEFYENGGIPACSLTAELLPRRSMMFPCPCAIEPAV